MINLITTHPRKYSLSNVKKFLSFTELIDSEPDENSVVVINSFEEDTYEAGLLLNELMNKHKIRAFLYLSDTPDLSISSKVSLSRGLVESEDYLADEETLEEMVELVEDSVKQNEIQDASSALTTIDLTGEEAIGIVSAFYRDFSIGSANLRDGNYLGMVNQAVTDLINNVDLTKEFLNRVRYTLTEVQDNTYDNITGITHELSKVKGDYANLLEKFEMLEGIRESETSNSVQSFNSFNMASTYGTKFIVFKEYSNVRYLTSFILGYKNHLENAMNKRVRVIFVIPNKYTYLEKYKNSPSGMAHYSIENEQYRSEECLQNKVGYTEKPINKLYTYFSQLSDDYILVVDRINESRPCVTGKVETWHCFSGKTETELYPGTQDKRILTMKGISKDDIVIPHIQKYPVEPAERIRLYDNNQSVKRLYDEMDKRNNITIK